MYVHDGVQRSKVLALSEVKGISPLRGQYIKKNALL